VLLMVCRCVQLDMALIRAASNRETSTVGGGGRPLSTLLRQVARAVKVDIRDTCKDTIVQCMRHSPLELQAQLSLGPRQGVCEGEHSHQLGHRPDRASSFSYGFIAPRRSTVCGKEGPIVVNAAGPFYFLARRTTRRPPLACDGAPPAEPKLKPPPPTAAAGAPTGAAPPPNAGAWVAGVAEPNAKAGGAAEAVGATAAGAAAGAAAPPKEKTGGVLPVAVVPPPPPKENTGGVLPVAVAGVLLRARGNRRLIR